MLVLCFYFAIAEDLCFSEFGLNLTGRELGFANNIGGFYGF